jgi:hypothetical protein
MQERQTLLRRTAASVLAILVGAVPAFLLIFKALITDVPPGTGGNTSIGFYSASVLVAYALIGALFGYVQPERSARWAGWLCLPVILPLAVAVVREPAQAPVTVAYGLLALSAAAAAAYAAARARRR